MQFSGIFLQLSLVYEYFTTGGSSNKILSKAQEMADGDVGRTFNCMFESPSFKNANSRTICSENVVEMRGKTSYLGARLCLGYKEQMKRGSVVNLERTTDRCDNIEC